MTTPNAELAYRTLDAIDAHPESWDQNSYFAATDCGTAACFAGWACLLSGDQPSFDGAFSTSDVLVDGRPTYASDRAEELLGVSRYMGMDQDGFREDLFSGGNTREDLGRLVAALFGPRPDYGVGCRCDWLGEGTPEHAPSPLCRSLRPDADQSSVVAS